MKGLKDSKQLYWGLIITFFVLYMCVGFVSTLHSITFFELTNSLWLAMLLGITYEVGQASVLFSILMSKNSQNILPWSLMILLTVLQVSANVFASFKFMDSSDSMDWQYWQRSILFWMQADGPEMFKVVISWISGALLPIVALGMTSLVAENLKHRDEKEDEIEEKPIEKPISKAGELLKDPSLNLTREPTIIVNDLPYTIDDLEKIKSEFKQYDAIKNNFTTKHTYNPTSETIKEPFIVDIPDQIPPGISGGGPSDTITELTELNNAASNVVPAYPQDKKDWVRKTIVEKSDQTIDYADDLKEEIQVTPSTEKLDVEISKDENYLPEEIHQDKKTELFKKIPVNNKRGWHLKKQYIDTNGDVYQYGVFQPNITVVPPDQIAPPEELKKA